MGSTPLQQWFQVSAQQQSLGVVLPPPRLLGMNLHPSSLWKLLAPASRASLEGQSLSPPVLFHLDRPAPVWMKIHRSAHAIHQCLQSTAWATRSVWRSSMSTVARSL